VNNLINDNSVKGTIITVIFGGYTLLDIDFISKAVFIMATITTSVFTSIYTYHKIKKLKNEDLSEKP
jgi:hypothetical protein